MSNTKDTVLIVGSNSQNAKYLQRLYQSNLETSDELQIPKAIPLLINTNRRRLDMNVLKAATKYMPKVMYYFHAVSDPEEAAKDPVYTHKVNYEDFAEACRTYWRIVPEGTVFYAGSILQFKQDEQGRRVCSLGPGDKNTVDFTTRDPYAYSKNKSYAFLMEMKDRGHNVKYGFLSRHDSKYRRNFIIHEICKAGVESYINKVPVHFDFKSAFEKCNRGFAGDYAEMIFQFAHCQVGESEAIFRIPNSFYSLHDIVNWIEDFLPGSRLNFNSTNSNTEIMELYGDGVFEPISPTPDNNFVYTSYKDTVQELLRTVYLDYVKNHFSNQNTCHL